MVDFFKKEDYSFEDIQSLIDNESEETINLEFKACGALDKSNEKKKEISKDVASFANSDGGIIIYGITEEEHKAQSFSFINGNIYTKEWVEQVIKTGIQQHIENLKIYPIRNHGNLEETVYLIKIPKSYRAPHISKDGRFYKRYNFQSVQMEEYEVRQLYERKNHAILSIDTYSITHRPTKSNEFYDEHEISIKIKNKGTVPETLYKINFYIYNEKPVEIYWHKKNDQNFHYSYMKNNISKVSWISNFPIFPNEQISMNSFTMKIPKNYPLESLKSLKTKVVLMYNNGENETEWFHLINKE